MVDDVVFAVAFQAKLHRQLDQQVLDIGTVRVVAVGAFAALCEGIVLDRRFERYLLDVLMAVRTERSGVFQKQLGLFGVVRVMAGHATLLSGKMSIFARR